MRLTLPNSRLLLRYWALSAALVLVPLLLLGGSELAIAYRENALRAARSQQMQATAVAVRIGDFLGSVERQVTDSAALPWNMGLLSAEAQRDEFERLLKLAPAVAEITGVDHEGRERVFVSRLDPNRLRDGRIPLDVALLRERQSRTVAYGTPYFRDDTEPYVALAVGGVNARAGTTIAHINLTFVSEALRQIGSESGTLAYVVDANGRLLAHPDLRLVLAQSDFSMREPIAQARAGVDSTAEVPVPISVRATNDNGEEVFASAARIPGPAWLVVIEQPLRELQADVRRSALRLLAMLLGGVAIAFVASLIFAHRLSRPILALKQHAQRVLRGESDASSRPDRRDEVGDLAVALDAMAERIADYTADLERRVAEKTQQLALANQHKSEFLANVSHELRTPLNAVIGFSEALQAGLFGTLNGKQREYVDDIHASGLHLLALINDLLDLSKVEAGRFELEHSSFDVPALLEAVCSLLRQRAQQAEVKLLPLAIPAAGTWIGDERRLRQVLINLVANALKFTRAGGEVKVWAEQNPSHLTLVVKDTGIGIAAVDLPRLFEPFTRVGGVDALRQEGTGLGLALTLRLVELHGGTIEVKSERGIGTVFTVRLPVLAR